MKYTENDIVKHWGILVDGEWLASEDAIIFAVTCPRVAEVQLDIIAEFFTEGERLEIAEVKR